MILNRLEAYRLTKVERSPGDAEQANNTENGSQMQATDPPDHIKKTSIRATTSKILSTKWKAALLGRFESCKWCPSSGTGTALDPNTTAENQLHTFFKISSTGIEDAGVRDAESLQNGFRLSSKMRDTEKGRKKLTGMTPKEVKFTRTLNSYGEGTK